MSATASRCAGATPAANTSARASKGSRPRSGLGHPRAMASGRDAAVRNGYARAREDLFGLVFVELHGLPNIAPPKVSLLETSPPSLRPYAQRVREDRDIRSARGGPSLR